MVREPRPGSDAPVGGTTEPAAQPGRRGGHHGGRKRSRRRTAVRGFRAIVLPASTAEAWWIASAETVTKRRDLLADLGIRPHAFARVHANRGGCRKCDRGKAFFGHDDDLRRHQVSAALAET